MELCCKCLPRHTSTKTLGRQTALGRETQDDSASAVQSNAHSGNSNI